MKFTLNMLNFKQVTEMIDITKSVITDERIPTEVRQEFEDRIKAIEWEGDEDV